MSALKPCPIGGCETRIALHLLMCHWHWGHVPPELQREVSWAYSGGDGLGTPAYDRAGAAAIAAVRGRFLRVAS